MSSSRTLPVPAFPKIPVRNAASIFHEPHRADLGSRQSLSGNREILDGASGLCTVKSLGRHFHRPHGVIFDSLLAGHLFTAGHHLDSCSLLDSDTFSSQNCWPLISGLYSTGILPAWGRSTQHGMNTAIRFFGHTLLTSLESPWISISFAKNTQRPELISRKSSADPFAQFQVWFDLSLKTSPGSWYESNAMTLATCGKANQPTARTVLLKGISSAGFEFFTNYDSAKGMQLAENPNASLLFHWPWLERQIRIEGPSTKTSRQRSLEYFHSRPRGAQIGAHASHQSSMIESRDVLDKRRIELEKKFENDPVPLPENWGGYIVAPSRFEFWQGRLDRLHDRIVYVRNENVWKLYRLSP